MSENNIMNNIIWKLFAYDSPVGRLTIIEQEEKLRGIHLCCELNMPKNSALIISKEETPLIAKAYKQLEEYFAGTRRSFDLPLFSQGTEFQQKVWQELGQIPYGKTASYGEIAARIACPRGARAVGMALNRNPWLIIVPCHRVIGADGSLTGFGAGLGIKSFLLQHEKQNFA